MALQHAPAMSPQIIAHGWTGLIPMAVAPTPAQKKQKAAAAAIAILIITLSF